MRKAEVPVLELHKVLACLFANCCPNPARLTCFERESKTQSEQAAYQQQLEELSNAR